jgi:putative thioredoxin
MTMTTHEITDFQTDVLDRSRQVPVLVDFWAAWCGPCRMLGPVLERLAAEAGGRWVLAKVDTEAHPDLAERYGIQGIPNCKLFVDGEVVDEFTGALPEPQLRRWLEQAVPSPATAVIGEAAAMLDAGRYYEAAVALRGVLEAEPANDPARMLLAQALLRLAPEQVEPTLAPLGEHSEHADRADALRTLARLVALDAAPGALPEGAAKVHVLDASRCLRAGDWDGTLAALIEAMRAERGYADGVAREAGRAVYRLLGIQHPACEKHHRAFASAMHV